MRFSIYRYDPDSDAKPYMRDYDIALEPTDRMLLDALVRIKMQDDSFAFRRSCREGVCGSDAMNINGKNGLACITRLIELKEPVVIRPLPGLPVIRDLIDRGIPTFGICLGHQMLGIALGGRTMKMHQGHHGANHPVKDLTTGKVEITSMNHGFAVDRDSLPKNVEETHVSLFDGSNCGLKLKDKPVFSVQYHPEASPGPQDSHYLFTRFVEAMEQRKKKAAAE